MNEQKLQEIISIAVTNAVESTMKELEKRNLLGKPKMEKTAYAKTEALLYNYMNFKKIVAERLQDIEDIKAYGVPQKSGSIVEYSSHGSMPVGLVMEEETVEQAIANVQATVQGTVQALKLIDRCLKQISSDPYYKLLEMRYFKDYTLEDIAANLDCNTATVSRNRSRLVKELALRLFPDQVIDEYMN